MLFKTLLGEYILRVQINANDVIATFSQKKFHIRKHCNIRLLCKYSFYRYM